MTDLEWLLADTECLALAYWICKGGKPDPCNALQRLIDRKLVKGRKLTSAGRTAAVMLGWYRPMESCSRGKR